MIIGVCKYLSYNENENFNKVLLLDGLQDPGNIGTLIRSALGFGIDLVVLSNDSVDLYNDKLIRSSQGALFKVKTVQKDIKEMISLLKKHNIKVFGTSLKNGKNLTSYEKMSSYGLILGNEGNGVKKDILSISDENIFIEMNQELESLNVAISGAIIMHYFYSKH